MGFDPTQPFEEVGTTTATLPAKSGFDPAQPFEVVGEAHQEAQPIDWKGRLLDGITSANYPLYPWQKRGLEDFVSDGTDSLKDMQAEAVTQAFVSSKMPGWNQQSIRDNWPAVKTAFAKNYLGAETGDISNVDLSSRIIERLDKENELPVRWEQAKSPIEKLAMIREYFAHPWARYEKSVEQSFERPKVLAEIPAIENAPAENEGVQVAKSIINAGTGTVNFMQSSGGASIALNPLALAYATPYFAASGWESAKKTFGDFADSLYHGNVSSGQLSKDVLDTSFAVLAATAGAMHGIKGTAGMVKGAVALPEVAKTLRDEATKTPNPNLQTALNNAADHFEAKADEQKTTATASEKATEAPKMLPENAQVTVMDMAGKRAVQIDIPGEGDRPAFSGSVKDAEKAGYSIPAETNELPEGKHIIGDIKGATESDGANPAEIQPLENGFVVTDSRGNLIDYASNEAEAQRIADAHNHGISSTTESQSTSLQEPAGGAGSVPILESSRETEPAPASSEITGIAHRVSEARGAEAPRGEGISPADSVEHGRELLAKGMSPEEAANKHAATGYISADAMALVRAQTEKLSAKTKAIYESHGPESPEGKAAWEKEKAWIERIKPMQTEWHKIGQAQQGETEIDTGTFHGLQRAFNESTGKDFTPEQADKAHEIAKSVTKATESETKAKDKLLKAALGEEAEKLVRPPNKQIRDYISSQAEAARARIAARLEKSFTISAVEGEKVSSLLSKENLEDLAMVGADYLAKGITKSAEWADAMVKEFGEKVRPHLDDIFNRAKGMVDESKTKTSIATHEPDSKWTSGQAVSLWESAKENYFDKGVSDFDDIRHGLANDLGLSVEDITKGLATPKGLRVLTDEMYSKAAEKRRVINQAKSWLTEAKTPGWMNNMKSVPGFFFNLATMGHGTVGGITHMGIEIFDIPAAKDYWTAFGQQFKLLGWHDRGAYHERVMQDLVRDPLYIKAKRAGLANDPFKYQDDYQNALAVKFFKKIGLTGNRGFDALKLFRQARFNARWEALPADLKTPEMAKEIASLGNHETGVVTNVGKFSIANAPSWLLFAPKLEASRWAYLVGDPAKAAKIIANWENETPESHQFVRSQLKQKAYIAGTYLGALAINQGLLSASGSDEEINFTDPRHSDWLSFKGAGHKVGVISPMIGSVRFLANLFHDATADRTSFEKMQGSRADKMAEDTKDYLRGKLSPFSKLVVDTATQSDFRKNTMPWSKDKVSPSDKKQGAHQYTYTEYALKNLGPIPTQEFFHEVWKNQGMSNAQIDDMIKALFVAGVMGSTGARVSEDFSKKKR